MSHYKQVRRKKRLERVRKMLQEKGYHEATYNVIKQCIAEFGCTRRKAIEYIAEATE